MERRTIQVITRQSTCNEIKRIAQDRGMKFFLLSSQMIDNITKYDDFSEFEKNQSRDYQYTITEEAYQKIKDLNKKYGVSVSEIVNFVLNKELENLKKIFDDA